jgi:hypothetical protein
MRIVQKGPFGRFHSVRYQTLKVCFDQSCKRLCMYESLCAWLTVDRFRMRSYLGFTKYTMISQYLVRYFICCGRGYPT